MYHEAGLIDSSSLVIKISIFGDLAVLWLDKHEIGEIGETGNVRVLRPTDDDRFLGGLAAEVPPLNQSIAFGVAIAKSEWQTRLWIVEP